jgi:hypothetical protein
MYAVLFTPHFNYTYQVTLFEVYLVHWVADCNQQALCLTKQVDAIVLNFPFLDKHISKKSRPVSLISIYCLHTPLII